jgi:hypothetical protein
MCRSLARSVTALKFSYLSDTSPSGIRDCLGFVSSDLYPISGSDMLPVKSLEKGPGGVYATRVLLRKILDGVQKLTPTDLATAGKSDEELLEYLTNTASCQINILENWRSALPSHLAWEYKELPSTDPLRASLRAEYYSGISTLLRPYLEIVRDCECFSATMDKPSAGQRGLIGVIQSWVQAAVASTIAFDRIGAGTDSAYETFQSTNNSPVMLSNPVESLHAQVVPSFYMSLSTLTQPREFENVLILQALHSSAIYPWLDERTKLTETTLDTLHSRTVDRLSEVSPRSPLLSRDLKILRMLRSQGDSVALLDLATIVTSASTP